MAASHTKSNEFEDQILQFQRDREALTRQLGDVRDQLAKETAQRQHQERQLRKQKNEIEELRERETKLMKEYKIAADEVKEREKEIRQLESRQDKTVVEHIHVLEEAKRVTDRELQRTQKELLEKEQTIKTLEKVKTRLLSETEDVTRQAERDRAEARAKEKMTKNSEEKMIRSLRDVQHSKDVAELFAQRLQSDLQHLQQQHDEIKTVLEQTAKSKNDLEAELEALLSEMGESNAVPQARNFYEKRITELEKFASEIHTKSAETAARVIKDLVSKQRSDLQQLIITGTADTRFQERLLREIEIAEGKLTKEVAGISRKVTSPIKTSSIFNHVPKLGARKVNEKTPRPPSPGKQVEALKQHVQVLELQMVASERVRRHLETSLRQLMDDLESGDEARRSITHLRARLTEENSRLAQLLETETEARKAAEAAQLDNIQSMWKKFKDAMDTERQNTLRLEELRKVMVSLILNLYRDNMPNLVFP